ncbi:MAG: hypothetical protein CMH47_13365 [Muricauda sp.]|nr:hypothetical protein [Allomuricauda sp.]
MMFIDRNRVQVLNQKWSDKSAELLQAMENTENVEERNKIIDKHHRYWKLFKSLLKSISYNKCWYSETRNPYSHYHVDHFRPKKKVIELDGKTEREGYWWLTFDFTNYRLCGSVGNTKKSNHFAVEYNKVTVPGPIDDEGHYLLDPFKREDVQLLNFNQEGRAVESVPEDKGKWQHNRARYTIEVLDLNYPDLVEERKQKWMEVSLLIKSVNKLEGELNEAPSATKQANLEAKKNELRKLLAPCSELTATVKACLRSSGQDWAYRLLEEEIREEICQELEDVNQ